jgi:L-rhamnose-H+ transport protein
MKYSRTWRWENTWLLFCILALLVFPWLVALRAAPGLFRLLSALPPIDFLPAVGFGFLWGIGQAAFGLGIDRVGTAVAFAIVIGMSSVLGSLIPLVVMQPEVIFQVRGLLLLVSAAILAAGLTVYGKAGSQRERDAGADTAARRVADFRVGLWICIIAGMLGGMLNLGFAFSGKIAAQAVAFGLTPIRATYVIWPFVLTAGFIPNLLYTVFLLRRNHTVAAFARSPFRGGLLSLGMAVFWLSGVQLYGVGAAVIGRFGTSIGFAVFMITLILWSSSLGIITGEWRGARPATFRRMQLGLGILVLALFVLSITGLL